MKTVSYFFVQWSWLASLVGVCFFSFWFGLGATRLWDRDEPRNARCSVEMLDRNDWVVPYFNDQLRTHKPILLYWMEMLAYQVWGENAFAARLPSALMGTGTVAAIALLAWRMIGPRTAFWAACSLATSLMMVVASRAATPDASLICTSTWGVVGLVLHWQTSSARITPWWWVGFIAMGLAILAKGPVGIVLPSLVVGLWCFLQQVRPEDRLRPLVLLKNLYTTARRLHVVAGLLLALAIAIPWYVWVGIRTDGRWLYGFFWEHNLSRAVSSMEGHGGGVWYYPLAALVGLFPWSLLLIPVVYWTWKSLQSSHVKSEPMALATASEATDSDCLNDRWVPLEANAYGSSTASLLGLLWIAVYVGLFSCARTKLPSYITPCYPGAALLIGGFLSQWSMRLVTLSRPMMLSGAAVYGIAGFAITGSLYAICYQNSIVGLELHSLWPLGFVAAGIAMVFFSIESKQHRMPGILVLSTAVVIGALFGFVAPAIDLQRTDLNEMIRIEKDSNKKTTWLAVRTIEPSWVFYLEKPIAEMSAEMSTGQGNDKIGLKKIAEHLSMPDSKLLVSEEDWISLQKNLDESFGLQSEVIQRFSPFLKNQKILVVQAAANEHAPTPAE